MPKSLVDSLIKVHWLFSQLGSHTYGLEGSDDEEENEPLDDQKGKSEEGVVDADGEEGVKESDELILERRDERDSMWNWTLAPANYHLDNSTTTYADSVGKWQPYSI